jgi:putative ABC transport system permease protein
MFTLLSKVWFELWQDKARTIQVVMVIALGAIGIGLVVGGRNLVAGTVSESWQAAQPPHIKLSVNPPLTSNQMDRLARLEGVAEVEGLYNARVEWRLAGSDEWQTGALKSREDYGRQKMELDEVVSGQWPGRNTLAIGIVSVGEAGVSEGDTVEMRFSDTVRTFDIVGTIDSVGPSPVFNDTFYADRRTFSRISGRDTVDLIQLRDVTFDQARAEATDLRIQEYFENIGVDSVGVLFPFQDRIVPPVVPPAATILNAIFLLLGIIGVIIVILGIFLVYNSVSAIVYQQVNQIGVMKAIGASAWQVIWSYLVLVLGYGILAAVISIPIGAVAAFGLQSFFANFLNLEVGGISVDPVAVMVQVAICLVAPLFAALVPLGGGMRITVREAISTYGISGSVGLVDRMVAKARNIPYTLLLTIGNTFRNRRRVLVVEVSLVVAGIIFMMVMGVNDATKYTFGEKLAAIHNYQVTLALKEPARVKEIETTVQNLADVTAVESWLVLPASARPASQPDKEVTDARVTIFGQPAETSLYRPELQAGRWLRPDDVNAAVVGLQVSEEKGWRVGDWITLADSGERELDVQIVGVLFDPVTDSSVHMPLGTLQRQWNMYGQANTVWVQSEVIDVDTQTAVARTLDQALERRGIEIAPNSTFGETTIAGILEQNGQRLNIIIRLLAVMAVVIALVGGVGLSGVISLSVLERRREIGVMRAIGASSWQVIRLFMGEGILLGLISWLIALPLSIPAAYGLSTQGLSLALNQQLSYNFTPNGALLWLTIIIMLAVIASLLPARKAALVSVRESLAYQ